MNLIPSFLSKKHVADGPVRIDQEIISLISVEDGLDRLKKDSNLFRRLADHPLKSSFDGGRPGRGGGPEFRSLARSSSFAHQHLLSALAVLEASTEDPTALARIGRAGANVAASIVQGAQDLAAIHKEKTADTYLTEDLNRVKGSLQNHFKQNPSQVIQAGAEIAFAGFVQAGKTLQVIQAKEAALATEQKKLVEERKQMGAVLKSVDASVRSAQSAVVASRKEAPGIDAAR